MKKKWIKPKLYLFENDQINSGKFCVGAEAAVSADVLVFYTDSSKKLATVNGGCGDFSANAGTCGSMSKGVRKTIGNICAASICS